MLIHIKKWFNEKLKQRMEHNSREQAIRERAAKPQPPHRMPMASIGNVGYEASSLFNRHMDRLDLYYTADKLTRGQNNQFIKNVLEAEAVSSRKQYLYLMFIAFKNAGIITPHIEQRYHQEITNWLEDKRCITR